MNREFLDDKNNGNKIKLVMEIYESGSLDIKRNDIKCTLREIELYIKEDGNKIK